MKDNGNKINLVVKENKYLSMVPHTKVNSKMAQSMAMAFIIGRMVHHIRELGKTMSLMVQDNICGVTVESM